MVLRAMQAGAHVTLSHRRLRDQGSAGDGSIMRPIGQNAKPRFGRFLLQSHCTAPRHRPPWRWVPACEPMTTHRALRTSAWN